MTSAKFGTRLYSNRQAGQTTTIVALVMGIFLLGLAGLAVDVSNWWLHRQMAQGAADAACTAGVMDMLGTASGGGAFGNFPSGSPPAAFNCSAAPTAAACQYAALNGYNGAGRLTGQASNDVQISFPASVPGLATCSPTNPPPCVPATTTVANPFLLVNVVDRVPTTFTGLLSGKRTQDVTSSAVCGVLQATAPVPIIVMNPSCQHAFELSGSTTVQIVGGPTRSVEVNSSNGTCAAATNSSGNQCNGNPTIDLSKGGPNFTGSEFAVVGQPGTPPSGFNAGTTGDWSNGGPISDPYALLSAPTLPAQSPTDDGPNIKTNQLSSYAGYVMYHVDGCPDTAGCIEYQPGLYHQSIVVKGYTAIFAPGIYYLQPASPNIDTENGGSPGSGCLASNGPFNNSRDALAVNSNGVVRPSTATGDGSKGVMFYLTGANGTGTYASVFFGSNAGTSGGRTIDPFQTSTITCDGSSLPTQLNVPATVTGDVLLGQCTTKGTYFGAGSTDTLGSIRGLIFFQDRANADTSGQPSMQGGGGLVFAGNMYFHNCNSSGTGTNCSLPNVGYQAFYQLQGLGSPGSGSGTYFLGNITADELVINGGGTLAMSLNPNAIYNILKASLLE